ncbi:unnamed protein product [Heterobilharzia americana]|nr:unnamed protein product [Heterobilharzia americana]
MIKKYVKLDPDDEFSSSVLIKRHGEQLKNKHKASKWSRLHVTNTELWLSGAYWWPNSILNGIHLSEVNCLITFYSTPNLLAMGIAHVCMNQKSNRDQLVKTLTTLCGNRYKQSEKKFNIPVVGPPVNIVEISLSPDIKQSVNVEKSIENNQESQVQLQNSTVHNNSDTYVRETTIKIERPISPIYAPPLTAPLENPSNTSVSVETCDFHASLEKPPIYKPHQEVQRDSVDNTRPPRLKRFISPYHEGLESGLNPKDLIHVYYDSKRGNIITEDGPIYLYCVNCPSE